MNKEKKEIIEAKFQSKNGIILHTVISRYFNSSHMTIKAESNIVVQKNLTEKLVLVDLKDNAKKLQGIEQRARGTYIALICESETIFKYSIALQ